MTTTKSPVNGNAPGLANPPTPDRSTDVDDPAIPARRGRSSPVLHRNEVVVVGELAPPVEPRRRADGSEVLTFRVAVRSPEIGRDPAARDQNPAGRRDILDCVVSSTAVRRRLATYRPGDVVELAGSLRHRFWNTAGRVQSRYEIEVGTLKRLARDRTPPSPGSAP